MSIGNYKRIVESHVGTTYKLGSMLAFGLTLMEPSWLQRKPFLWKCFKERLNYLRSEKYKVRRAYSLSTCPLVSQHSRTRS